MSERIYLSPPDMSQAERDALLAAFDSNWIAPLGPEVDAFERALSEYVGVHGAAALSSGTAALHLGLHLLGVGPGDEVWLPTLTFAATANAVRYVGATPVFIDSEPRSWNLDPALLADALASAAKTNALPDAIIAVDIYGQCADYGPIVEACAQYGIPLIEDAAEALGATHGHKRAGSFGVLSALSFNGNKIITTGGGGALLSNDDALVTRARHLASQAREAVAHYEHREVGFNYRLNNLLAAIGRSQLARLPELVRRRRAIRHHYQRALSSVAGLGFMPEASHGQSNAWLTCLTIDPAQAGVDREALRRQLEAHQIEARPVWKPMHRQPVFADCRSIGGAVADQLFATGLCLPSGSALSEVDLTRIVEAFLQTPGLTVESEPREASR